MNAEKQPISKMFCYLFIFQGFIFYDFYWSPHSTKNVTNQGEFCVLLLRLYFTIRNYIN